MNARTTSLTRPWMGKAIPLFAMLTVVLLGALAPRAARAQSCHDILQGHIDWALAKPDGLGDYNLLVTIVSNSLSMNATFIEGALHRQVVGGSDVFTGPGYQYFSKRRYGQNYPFNPLQTDGATVTLNADTSRATLALSGGTYNFDLECDNFGVLYGRGNSQSYLNIATPMFVISVKRKFVQVVN